MLSISNYTYKKLPWSGDQGSKNSVPNSVHLSKNLEGLSSLSLALVGVFYYAVPWAMYKQRAFCAVR